MNVAELAYTAGIIDGEGCIIIHIQSRTNTSKVGYQAKVFVGNTSEELIRWLARNYGGKAYFEANKNAKRKDIWRWVITGNKVLTFLELVYPYLRLKKAQAELAINFQKVRRGKGHPFTEDELGLAKMQKALMNGLNKRGK